MRTCVLAAVVVALGVACTPLQAAEMKLVEDGVSRARIVIPEDTPQINVQAANELADYLEKISGAHPAVMVGEPEPVPEHAVWVGYQPKLEELFPDLDFDFQHPEEILCACDGRNLVIAGRDRVVGGKQTEHGTANAVYTFLEDYLDVRWLFPGELGEDVIRRRTIAFSPFRYRYHPQFRKRLLWPRNPRNWLRRQRILYHSYDYLAGHAFTDWWEKYHETHPEWFALRGNGTRTPEHWGPKPNPHAVKLCVTNPQVWDQWLENTEKALNSDPARMVVSATPNDGLGFCVCDRCRAWDHPDVPPGVLTDRYVKFWNILARRLKKRFPNREVYLGAYAYSAYREPPLAAELEDNIAIGYVGSFPLAGEATTRRQRENWLAWAKMATSIVYRPNLFHSSGGFNNFPNVATRRTIDAFKFLAANKCVGVEVDTLPNAWATQGPQYYLMAQLMYNPHQDAQAVMADYYRRAFGPAAPEVEQYFSLLEDGLYRFLETIWHASGKGRLHKEALFPVLEEIWGDEKLLAAAEVLLDRAAAKLAGGPDIYRRRLAYIRSGLDYTRLQARIMAVMTKVRESNGADRDAVEKAIELCKRRDQIDKDAGPYALRRAGGYGHVPDHFGPPAKRFLEAAAKANVRLARPEWKLAWQDDFEREGLGDEWRALDGAWSVEDGHLVSRGGKLVTARKFPGLQRLEFAASISPGPAGVVSDLSSIIHGDADGRGYLVQFGGYRNTMSSIQRLGHILIQTRKHTVEPGKVHEVVAELDGNTLRLTVDGETALEHPELAPLLGPEHQRVGFYVYAGKVKIDHVKLYTSEAVRLRAPQGKAQIPDDAQAR